MKHDVLDLVVERPVAGGRMLARHDGRVVLVSGTMPGERVRAKVERTTRQVTFATTVDVIEPSPARRAPVCDLACGGSDYAHIAIERQRELKAEVLADTFRRIGKMPLAIAVPVAASEETGYRLRGRLHVRDRRAGFFVERTHRLCDAAATRQFVAGTIPVVEKLLDVAGPYADACDGIMVAENVAATERVCHLEPREGARLDRADVRWSVWEGLTGVTTRVGDRLVLLAGNGRVTDSASQLGGENEPVGAGAVWTRSAASFFQGNRYLAGSLMRRVTDWAAGPRVLDLYAGVGLFSIGLAALGCDVTAVEGDPFSAADLELNARAFPTRMTVRQASVEAAVATMTHGAFDTVVLDPPRTGASSEAVAGVIEIGPPRIVYVSCDPATLARDAGILAARGYRAAAIEVFDMFPNTSHIETALLLERA